MPDSVASTPKTSHKITSSSVPTQSSTHLRHQAHVDALETALHSISNRLRTITRKEDWIQISIDLAGVAAQLSRTDRCNLDSRFGDLTERLELAMIGSAKQAGRNREYQRKRRRERGRGKKTPVDGGASGYDAEGGKEGLDGDGCGDGCGDPIMFRMSI